MARLVDGGKAAMAANGWLAGSGVVAAGMLALAGWAGMLADGQMGKGQGKMTMTAGCCKGKGWLSTTGLDKAGAAVGWSWCWLLPMAGWLLGKGNAGWLASKAGRQTATECTMMARGNDK